MFCNRANVNELKSETLAEYKQFFVSSFLFTYRNCEPFVDNLEEWLSDQFDKSISLENAKVLITIDKNNIMALCIYRIIQDQIELRQLATQDFIKSGIPLIEILRASYDNLPLKCVIRKENEQAFLAVKSLGGVQTEVCIDDYSPFHYVGVMLPPLNQ